MNIVRVTQKYIPTCANYLKQQAKTAKNDIFSSAKYYNGNFKDGWKAGSRLASFKDKKPVPAFFTKMSCSLGKTKIRQKDIPAILGGIGLMTPIPAASLGGYALGKVINKVVNLLRKH